MTSCTSAKPASGIWLGTTAISTDGVNYTYEPGVRFGVEGRAVIDCAVALHQGLFHLYAPDHGAGPDPGRRAANEPASSRPRDGAAYHATSKDGLNFARRPDVRLDGGGRFLGNALSDGDDVVFFGSGSPGLSGRPGGGLWMGTSNDGDSWRRTEKSWGVRGADPGAVRLRDRSWLLVVTGEPRPGTPSANQRRGSAMPPDQFRQPRDSAPPPESPDALPGEPAARNRPMRPANEDGPRNHRILLATSKDGLAWTVQPQSLAKQASVPELFAGPDGGAIVLFVDTSDPQRMVDLLTDDLALQLFAFKADLIRELDRKAVTELAAKLEFHFDWTQEATLRTQASQLLDRYSLRATCWVLEKARDFAQQNGKKLLVILFDPSRAMAELKRGEKRYDQEIVDFLKAGKFHYFDMNEVHLRDFERYSISWDDYLRQYFIGHYNPRGNHFFAYSIKDTVVQWLDPKPITYQEPDPDAVDFKGYLPDAS